MNVITRTRFELVPLTEHIGAELRGIDLRERPDQETIAAIYRPGSITSSSSFQDRRWRRRTSSA